MTKKKIFVILVAFKNMQYIDGCIGSLLRQELPEERIILVDNASPYGEADYVAGEWPKIHVIRLEANTGFSKANNEGMKLALSLEADYCLLLNLDTVVCDGMLESLLSSIPSGDNGISTARIYATRSRKFNQFESKESMAWYTGGNIDRKTFIINQQLYSYEDTTMRNVEFASGCCMLIPREVIKRAGLLDEDYFLYYEDVDYCLRLQELGIRIIYNPNALLWHAEGGSQNRGKKASDYYWTRNRLLCVQKHMEMLQTDPLELLKDVVKNEDYFIGYSSRHVISYEKKAVEDFMADITGQITDHAYYFDESFEKETREGDRGAVWSTNMCGSILLCNYSDYEKYLELEFGIDTEDARENSTYTLYLDGKLYKKKCVSRQRHRFVIPFDSQEQHRLTVVKDRNRCVIRESDGIPLFFRLDSFRLKEYQFDLESGALKTENIGETECGHQLRWNWIQAERSNIVLVNPFKVEKKYRISFSTYSPSDQKRVAFSIDGECFEEEVGKEFIYELAVGAQKQISICFYEINKGDGDKYLSLIDFKWELLEGFSTTIVSDLVQTSPYIRGFGEPEQEGDRYWNWILSPQAKIVVRNGEHFRKAIRVSFCTFSPCDRRHYVLKANGRKQECTVGEEIVLDYDLPIDGEMVLLFSDMGSPKALENGTELYMSVINFKIEELKTAQCQIDDSERVVLHNQACRLQRYRICFNTLYLDQRLKVELPGMGDSFTIEPKQVFTYETMLEENQSMEVLFVSEGDMVIEDLLAQIDFLITEIDFYEASADCRLAMQSNYIQGFGDQEQEGDRYWNWIVRPQAKVVIHNREHFGKVIRISFCTFSPCDQRYYTLKVNGREQKCTIGEEMVLDYALPMDGELVLFFNDMGSSKVLEDGTELYMSVINFKTEELKAVQFQIDNDERVVLHNQAWRPQRYRIGFNTRSIEQRLEVKMPARGDFFTIEPQQVFTYETMLEENQNMELLFASEEDTDIGNLLDQIDFLAAEIDFYEAGADYRLAVQSNYIQGFENQEQEGDRYWNWIVKPQAKVVIHNRDHFEKVIGISFCTFSACDHKNYTLRANEKQQELIVGEEENLEYRLPADGEVALFFSNMGSPKVLDDGRELYMSVINFNVTEWKAVQWQLEECGRVILCNQSPGPQRYCICFDTINLSMPLYLEIPCRKEDFFIPTGQLFSYEVLQRDNENMNVVFRAEDCADMGQLLEQINFRVIEIESFKESADCQLTNSSNYIQGFGEQERDDNSYWNWIVKPNANIVFHNTDDTDKCIQISYNTYSACDNKTYILAVNGKEQKLIVGEEFKECYELSAGDELCLCFRELGRALELEDGRKLYLSILNFRAVMSET